MANRRNSAARSTRAAADDGRQLSFVVREPEAAPPDDPPKLALQIPPPSSPSAVRRLDLAARWAADLGELAAELVAEGKLAIDPGGARATDHLPRRLDVFVDDLRLSDRPCRAR